MYNRFDISGSAAKDESWILTSSESVVRGGGHFNDGSYPLDTINVERIVDVV